MLKRFFDSREDRTYANLGLETVKSLTQKDIEAIKEKIGEAPLQLNIINGGNMLQENTMMVSADIFTKMMKHEEKRKMGL